ncbi:hypothetical protein KX729_11235 [Rhizobium sp. XQZ8]|uniref:hypothetical protein n=1 Tax=Rhizobium populisoli TaxID=2859785 RepID=UPI001CA5D5B9|nr:hypothetical protein [Rhizobium populisoli]MBW6422018.1 hypothetical protein [Rhizobium populisoli]
MEFTSETEEAPKGSGHILKPMKLQKAFAEAGIELPTRLSRVHDGRFLLPGILLRADFAIPTPSSPFERLYIQARAFKSDALPEIRSQVDGECIPHALRPNLGSPKAGVFRL